MAQQTKIPGLPTQKEWVVVGVREGKLTDNPNGGQLQAYYVDFVDAPDVYWRRKVPATVEVGKSYFGTISEGDRGPAFKKETPQDGGGSAASSSSSGGARTSSSGGRTFKPESQFDPEKVARMGRAHAQEMALRFLAQSNFEIDATSDTNIESAKQWVSNLCDWFEEDVNHAGAAAGGATSDAPVPDGTPESASAVPPPTVPPGTVPEPEYVLKVCEDAGLSTHPAQKLHAFILRLQPEGQAKAVAGLADLERQAETLASLKSLYLQHEGEELPPTDPAEDDIPF